MGLALRGVGGVSSVLECTLVIVGITENEVTGWSRLELGAERG